MIEQPPDTFEELSPFWIIELARKTTGKLNTNALSIYIFLVDWAVQHHHSEIRVTLKILSGYVGLSPAVCSKALRYLEEFGVVGIDSWDRSIWLRSPDEWEFIGHFDQDPSGYIYVVSDGERYKIGKSKYRKTRVQQVIRANGAECKELFVLLVDDRHTAERAWLHAFEYLRISGKKEWFQLTARELRWMRYSRTKWTDQASVLFFYDAEYPVYCHLAHPTSPEAHRVEQWTKDPDNWEQYRRIYWPIWGGMDKDPLLG